MVVFRNGRIEFYNGTVDFDNERIESDNGTIEIRDCFRLSAYPIALHTQPTEKPPISTYRRQTSNLFPYIVFPCFVLVDHLNGCVDQDELNRDDRQSH